MALADYAHHNEDARAIWWQEEGRFEGGAPDPYDYDDVPFDTYCACEDDDDVCEFYVEDGFVFRSCTHCGSGEGYPLDSDHPRARRWARIAGVSA